MTKSNDFSDRQAYILQAEIPRAMSSIRNHYGVVPMRVKKFLLDKIKLNDNSNNEFSDSYYIGNLMVCLANSLVVQRLDGVLGYDPESNYVQETNFQKDALNEIERYRRIDEWASSYENIYSDAALICLQILTQNKIIPLKLSDFVQYTRPSNAHNIRSRAFTTLMELGLFEDLAVMKFIWYNFYSDFSPHMRTKIWRTMWLGLAHTAIGDLKQKSNASQINDGLVVEREVSLEERQLAIARSTSIVGALEALTMEMGHNEVLQQCLSQALSSPRLSLQEYVDVLDLCRILYEPQDAMILKLKYPRYWTVRYSGQGKLVFKADGNVRTKQTPKKVEPPKQPKIQPAPAPTPAPAVQPPVLPRLETPMPAPVAPQLPTPVVQPPKSASPSLKRQRNPSVADTSTADSSERPLKQRKASRTPTPSPATPATSTTVPPSNGLPNDQVNGQRRKSRVVLLRFTNKKRLAEITSGPPTRTASQMAPPVLPTIAAPSTAAHTLLTIPPPVARTSPSASAATTKPESAIRTTASPAPVEQAKPVIKRQGSQSSQASGPKKILLKFGSKK